MSLSTALLSSQYLPPSVYFSVISTSDIVLIERNEHYQKQSYRNRCTINTSAGPHSLIIPVTRNSEKVFIRDIRIDYGQKWLITHWRAIRSAYNKAPFFPYYADDLEKVLFGKFVFLYDLNMELLSMCLKWLGWNVQIKETLSYEKTVMLPVEDFRNRIHPKKALLHSMKPYPQVFGNAFADGLSIIDLIFCAGPEAAGIVSMNARNEHL